MSDIKKTKIIDIQTGKSERNVKSLKTQIRELRDQLGMLEQGTAEYNNVARELADLNQRQIEVNEAMMFSNKDIGQTLSNLTVVSAGVIGAFNGVSAVMQMMGADSEEAQKAMQNIQMTMALIQGMSALDTAIQAFEGLRNAFRGLNAERVVASGATVASAAATVGEAAALKDNTEKMIENNAVAERYTEVQIDNTAATEKSRKSIEDETKALLAKKGAMEGDMAAVQEYIDKLAELRKVQTEDKTVGDTAATNTITKWLEREIEATKDTLDAFNKIGESVYADKWQKKLERYQTMLDGIKDGTINATSIAIEAFKSLQLEMTRLYDSPNDVTRIQKEMEDVAKALSPEQLKSSLARVQDDLTELTNDYLEKLDEFGDEMGEFLTKEYNQQKKALEGQQSLLEKRLNTVENQIFQEQFYERQINETNKSTRKNTAETVKNTVAKEVNAEATEEIADATEKANRQNKLSVPLHKQLANGIKGIGNAIGTLVKANPVLTAIIAALAAVGVAFGLYIRHMRKVNEHTKTMNDLNAQANHLYEEQTVRLNTLLNTANDETETVEERKAAVKALNEMVPEYNAQLDETSGKYTANAEALETYLDNLKEKLKLEAYEGKIKEYLTEQLELQEKINDIRASGFDGIRVFRKEKEIEKLNDKIRTMYDEIKKLDLSLALDETEITDGESTVKEFAKELRTIYLDLFNAIFDNLDLRSAFNGVYKETELLMSNIERIIKTSDLEGVLSDKFREGLDDISKYTVTLDFVFGADNTRELTEALDEKQAELSRMMNSKVSEDVLKKQQDEVALLKEQVAGRKALMDAVQKYADAVHDEIESEAELLRIKEEYIQQMALEGDYRRQLRGGDEYADLNKQVSESGMLVKRIEERIKARETEIKQLSSLPNQNERIYNRLKELNKERFEDEKALNEAIGKLDEAQYQKRMKHIELFYGDSRALADGYVNTLQNERYLLGGGTVDYNTELDSAMAVLQGILNTRTEVERLYDSQIAMAEGNAERILELEIEKQAALSRIEEDAAAQRVEIMNAEVNRKLNVQQTYVSAISTIAGQIQGLMSSEMSNYDENSKQYKNMMYANAVIDTLSGTLSAYMSGIQSGIPAPYNLAVASTMAGIVFATGLSQLRNIQNGTLSNTTAPSTVSFGAYDTLSYEQNAELISMVKDQKIWVSVVDITNAQSKVSVRETNSVF